MPTFKEIGYYLVDKWRELGGDGKQSFKDIFLYWGEKDGENHIHLYHEETGIWYYNIKCLNNPGITRKVFTLNISRSWDDILGELESTWKSECPAFFSGGNNKKYYNKYLKYKLKYLKLKQFLKKNEINTIN
jgi:hypothetical protein